MEPRDLGSTSLTWLTQEGFSVEQTSMNGFTSRFNIYSSARPDHKIVISQATGDDKIILSTGVTLGDSQIDRLRQVPYETRTELIRGLGAMLHGRSSLFHINEDQGIATRITISKAIYSDGFTKDRLMTAVNELFATHALVLVNLSDYFARLSRTPTDTMGPQETESAKPMTPSVPSPCRWCGAPTTLQQKFCTRCGKPLA